MSIKLFQTAQRAALDQLWKSTSHMMLFEHLKPLYPAFATFSGWSALIELIASRQTAAAASDALLMPLLLEYATSSDQRLTNILTAAYWPRLLAVHRASRCWDSDEQDRWQNVQVTFLQWLTKPDLHRASGLARRGYFGTLRRMHRMYGKQWRKKSQCRTIDAERLDLARSHPNPNLVAVDVCDGIQVQRDSLALQVRRGVIDEVEAEIIAATRLEGHSMRELAQRLGISGDAVKGRRRRAEDQLARVDCTIVDIRTLCSR